MDTDSQVVYSTSRPQTIRCVLVSATQRLKAGGIDSARLDADVLLCHALRVEKSQLYVSLDEPLELSARHRFGDLLIRRLHHEPIAYITGCQEFWSLDFLVTPDVLIPRPETERLVEISLECAGAFDGDLLLRILDIGTGSGALAVTLAKELPRAQVLATDVSPAALEIARHNAARHQVADRIQFRASNLFDSIREHEFHIIVANPPYVRRSELPALAPEVSQWEPRTALDGGLDGLDYYRGIVGQGLRHLLPGGALIMEIGAAMGLEITELLGAAGNYTPPLVYQDYALKDRVIVAHAASPNSA
ncbi:MAG TPA: peptide chain release factor N(5)-glutamine methyltransferase [Candidatus Binatia bacterium]|nr:peptide chain release factor N(5)-glutamine methyltransferase [Candidatus Binatia bacterium]